VEAPESGPTQRREFILCFLTRFHPEHQECDDSVNCVAIFLTVNLL
jgi:hypothetical protein